MRGILNKMLQFLARTDLPLHSYIWRTALIAFLPTVVIGVVVNSVVPGKGPDLDTFKGSVITVLLLVVGFSPWVETLLMWPILWVLKRLIPNTYVVALASAVIWALLHSSAAPSWGLVIFWPFFVFSLCFLEWEKRSKAKAIVATASVHMCQNLVPALAIILLKAGRVS